jgi:hypothetical protein
MLSYRQQAVNMLRGREYYRCKPGVDVIFGSGE